MIGKLLIGAGAYFLGSHIYGLLALTQSEEQAARTAKAFAVAKTLVGKVVKKAGSDKLYLLWNRGTKVEYTSYQAYVNDGSKEIVVLSDEIFDNIGTTTNAHINETGFYWDLE